MKPTIITFILLLFISTTVFSSEPVVLAIGEWAPYTSEKDHNGKVAEKIVTEAFKFESIDVVYEYYPWKRSLVLSAKGAKAGTFPWYKTEDRLNDFIYSKLPIIEIKNVFFHLKSFAFDWEKIEDLKKFKVGDTLGYASNKTYKENGINADVVPKAELNFKKLLAGRIDVYGEEYLVGFAMLNKNMGSDKAALFTVHPKPFKSAGGFLLISKKTPNGLQIMEKFDRGFKKLKETGGYDKIIAEVVGSK